MYITSFIQKHPLCAQDEIINVRARIHGKAQCTAQHKQILTIVKYTKTRYMTNIWHVVGWGNIIQSEVYKQADSRQSTGIWLA